MVNDNMIKFLANVSILQGLDNRQIKQIASRFVARTYQPNQAIVSQGKGGEGMFMILSGHAEAVLEMVDGTKTVVNEFGPTDFFGEVAMLDIGPRTASVVATEETECLVLSRSDFIALMENDAKMATEVAIALARRLRRVVGAM